MHDHAAPHDHDHGPNDPQQQAAAREHLKARAANAWVDAICRDDVEQVRKFLGEQPGRGNQFVTQPVPWGQEMWMPLHFAADAGAGRVVALLLDRGIQPQCRTRFDTPMHARQTPLHLSAKQGQPTIIQALIDHDAEVDVLDARSDRPLHVAARHGHADAVQALVAAGASLDPRNGNGRTPLHEAIRSSEGVSDDAANAAALALIEAGADVNADCPKEPEAWSPLMRCEAMGQQRAVVAQALRQRGAT